VEARNFTLTQSTRDRLQVGRLAFALRLKQKLSWFDFLSPNELRDSSRQARIQVAETQKYEKEREKNRKAHSPNRGTAQNPGDKSVGRSEQLKTSGSSAQGGEQAPAPEQNHVHNEREAGAVPTQMEYEGKGENAARSVKPSKDTLGRHVTSGQWRERS
jgi:hypothetical protein